MEDDNKIFEEAMAGVRRLPPQNVAPEMKRVESPEDEDELITIPEGRGFRRPGIQEGLLRDLRGGKIRIEGELDLHGYTQNEAKIHLDDFIQESQAAARQRAVRVIHGKGRGSPEGKPVLKYNVEEWLRQSGEVLAFCEAGSGDGGSGAVRILLRRRD